MFEFLFGVAFGIWIGTKHDFVPYIEIIKIKFNNSFNELKNEPKKEN
jgi:hypothetical protein